MCICVEEKKFSSDIYEIFIMKKSHVMSAEKEKNQNIILKKKENVAHSNVIKRKFTRG